MLSGVPTALTMSLSLQTPENSGPIKSVIRDADCFEQMTGTEPSNPGHDMHKTGRMDNTSHITEHTSCIVHPSR